MERVLVNQKPMTLFRTFVAALVALSVATLPASGQFILTSSPHETATGAQADTGALADTGAQADMSCCPDCASPGDLQTPGCILKCAALAGAILPSLTVSLRHAGKASPFWSAGVSLRGVLRAPPTHPPPA
jgi:hypothetical protein